MKWQALRNRVAAIQAKLPGPQATIMITGGLPAGASSVTAAKESPPSTTAAPPARAQGKATSLLKAAGEPSDT